MFKFKPLKFVKKHPLLLLTLAVLLVMTVLLVKKEGLEAYPSRQPARISRPFLIQKPTVSPGNQLMNNTEPRFIGPSMPMQGTTDTSFEGGGRSGESTTLFPRELPITVSVPEGQFGPTLGPSDQSACARALSEAMGACR